MNEYIQEKIKEFDRKIGIEIVDGKEIIDIDKYDETIDFLTQSLSEAYNRGVEDTKKKIAKWVGDNTGGSGDVSYPDLMNFMAGTKDINKAIKKLTPSKEDK